MDPAIYRLIHFVGIFTLLFAFGSLFTSDKTTKGQAIGHGIGLVLILLGGFGMQAKYKLAYIATHGVAFPTWMILKVVIWLLFGAAMVLAKRQVIKGASAWVLIIALATACAWLAWNKPALGNSPAPIEAAASQS